MFGSIEAAIKIFILLAPFFILSVFISLTGTLSLQAKRKIALQSSAAILLIAFIVYFLGNVILKSLGITLDSFRIGSGLVLLLSGLEMVRGNTTIRKSENNESDDIAIVPLAIPCAMGPGTIGALLVMGSSAWEKWQNTIFDIAGVFIAVLFIAVMLYYANVIEQIVKQRGISILSKLTGLFLTTLAAQIIAQGIKGIFA